MTRILDVCIAGWIREFSSIVHSSGGALGNGMIAATDPAEHAGLLAATEPKVLPQEQATESPIRRALEQRPFATQRCGDGAYRA